MPRRDHTFEHFGNIQHEENPLLDVITIQSQTGTLHNEYCRTTENKSITLCPPCPILVCPSNPGSKSLMSRSLYWFGECFLSERTNILSTLWLFSQAQLIHLQSCSCGILVPVQSPLRANSCSGICSSPKLTHLVELSVYFGIIQAWLISAESEEGLSWSKLICFTRPELWVLFSIDYHIFVLFHKMVCEPQANHCLLLLIVQLYSRFHLLSMPWLRIYQFQTNVSLLWDQTLSKMNVIF